MLIKINDLHIQLGQDDGEFKARVYLGQINLSYNLDFIDEVIQKVNKNDLLFGSILGLVNMDSYFVIEL